jgi:putative transposase
MHAHLPRLAAESYQGFAFVHWTMTVDRRQIGWLDEHWHLEFREILLHTMTRYGLLCPVYCAMPDHLHLVWLGVRPDADQRVAAQFFRRHTNGLLEPWRWQKQAHDNVLTEGERKAAAFQQVCAYVLENPVRAGLVPAWQDYAFSGAMIPGYPGLSPRQSDFWEIFWRVYVVEVGGEATPSQARLREEHE